MLVFLGRIYEIAFRIAIMMADPGHGEGQAIFVAALGDEIEEVIRADQNIQSPRIAGLLSTAFFTPNFLIAIAASPPVEVTLPAISTAVAVVIHTGHNGLLLHWRLVDRDTGCC